jgi:stage III sporulation protein AF
MMEALTGWLTQIVLVVLLATFIDLMLPNRTMQRYVKLVVSLFILMTILSPVLQLFGANANVRMLAATVEGWSVGGTAGPGAEASPSGGASLPALGEVLSEGEAIARERNERSLEMLGKRVEGMVVEHVRTKFEAEATAEATMTLDADGLPALRGIRIRVGATLAAAEAEESPAPAIAEESGEAAAGEGLRIEPVVVEPIEIEPIEIGESQAEAAEAAPAPLSATKRKEIARSVAEAWGIPASNVEVE